MNRKIIALALPLALTLASCAQPTALPTLSPTAISAPAASGGVSNIDQVNRGIAVAEQTLTLLYQTALSYTSLPRCGTGPRICSDRAVVKEIRDRAVQAHNALVAARKNEGSVEHVWAAISAFRVVVPAS